VNVESVVPVKAKKFLFWFVKLLHKTFLSFQQILNGILLGMMLFLQDGISYFLVYRPNS
jgi:hypothetical protein